MQRNKVFNELKEITQTYSRFLEKIPAATFQQTPAAGGWSYSEVYSHIFDASILSLQAAASCKTDGELNKQTSFVVKVVLFFGTFPPAARYKVPKILESRVHKISPEEATVLMHSFLVKLEKYAPVILHSGNNLKVKHPRLGFLNASQWMRFILIHLKHHLKQLRRIEKRS